MATQQPTRSDVIPGQSDVTQGTTNHVEIRNWVEKRGGRPAITGGLEPLYIDFPDIDDRHDYTLVSWDDFFRIFDKNRLMFLFEEETSGGKESRFHKFVSTRE